MKIKKQQKFFGLITMYFPLRIAENSVGWVSFKTHCSNRICLCFLFLLWFLCIKGNFILNIYSVPTCIEKSNFTVEMVNVELPCTPLICSVLQINASSQYPFAYSVVSYSVLS